MLTRPALAPSLVLCPLKATRGWEVATLRHGVAGLLPEAAAQLGLFCRVYGHQLLVVDDYEFYDKQQVSRYRHKSTANGQSRPCHCRFCLFVC